MKSLMISSNSIEDEYFVLVIKNLFLELFPKRATTFLWYNSNKNYHAENSVWVERQTNAESAYLKGWTKNLSKKNKGWLKNFILFQFTVWRRFSVNQIILQRQAKLGFFCTLEKMLPILLCWEKQSIFIHQFMSRTEELKQQNNSKLQ